MRLIDADNLTPNMTLYFDFFAMMSVKKWIDEQPTIDAEPTRHGHWIECKEYVYDQHDERLKTTYTCSLCGRSERVREPYCNCGAKMNE